MKGLAPQPLKANELQLLPQCIAHDLATGAAGFGADGLQLLLQIVVQTDGEGVVLYAGIVVRLSGAANSAENPRLPPAPFPPQNSPQQKTPSEEGVLHKPKPVGGSQKM